MSHVAQLEFVHNVKSLFPEKFANQNVLEIGSLDINGTIRGFFDGCLYTGIDVGSGPGVDVVCEGQNYDAPDKSFDTVICCEVMEHNPYWGATFANMIRLLKSGGLMVMTCATTGRPEHGTKRSDSGYSSPLTTERGWEYYHNLTAKNIRNAVNLSLLDYSFIVDRDVHDLYMVGIKGHDSRVRQVVTIYRRKAIRAWRQRAIVAFRNPARLSAFLERRFPRHQ